MHTITEAIEILETTPIEKFVSPHWKMYSLTDGTSVLHCPVSLLAHTWQPGDDVHESRVVLDELGVSCQTLRGLIKAYDGSSDVSEGKQRAIDYLRSLT